LRFYGALLTPDFSAILGQLGQVTFGYR